MYINWEKRKKKNVKLTGKNVEWEGDSHQRYSY